MKTKKRVPLPKNMRPFYKGAPYKNGDAKNLARSNRFMHWICNSESGCYPSHDAPFTDNVYWRIFRIIAEFIEGFEFLSKLHREVSFFGSARMGKNHPFYKQAVELGRLCAEDGYTVITGGGPGIMEAGNKGAFEGRGESVGLDIELPTEQRRNAYVTRALGFHYFFTRKVMLSASAQAYVFFPGGFGTLDEATEMLTLVQTGKIPADVPCIFVSKRFWGPFLDWVNTTLFEENNFVNQKDVNLIQLVDTAEEAYKIIKKTAERTL